MEVKWIAIMMVGLALSAAIGNIGTTAAENKTIADAGKAGLEQCLKKPGSNSHSTLWVKSCKEYTETYMKIDQ